MGKASLEGGEPGEVRKNEALFSSVLALMQGGWRTAAAGELR